MKAGTQIIMADGTKGTVVYNNLDGVGIRYGHFDLSKDEIEYLKTSGTSFEHDENPPPSSRLIPEAMLREHYPSATLPCIGEDYEVTRVGIAL